MKYGTLLKMGAFVAVMGFAVQASAGPIVSWVASNAMSTASGDITLATGAGSDTVGTGIWVKNYVSGSPIMSSSVDAGYAGQDVFGVIQTSTTGGASVGLDDNGGNVMKASPAGLWIGVDGNNPDTGGDPSRAFASLVWFGLDAAPQSTDKIGAMSFWTNPAGGIDASVHFAVQSAGSWYVSEQAAVTADEGEIFNYAGGNWAALAVADSSSVSLMTAVGLTYDVGASSLDAITAVGYFQEGTVASGTARARSKMNEFTASVIPEPATFGLVAVFGGGVILLRRRFML